MVFMGYDMTKKQKRELSYVQCAHAMLLGKVNLLLWMSRTDPMLAMVGMSRGIYGGLLRTSHVYEATYHLETHHHTAASTFRVSVNG